MSLMNSSRRPSCASTEQDLTALGANIGDELRVASRRGTITAKARLDNSLPAGTIFMPFCYAEAAANILTNSALDPESKIPEYKFCAVSVDRVGKGVAVGRAPRFIGVSRSRI